MRWCNWQPRSLLSRPTLKPQQLSSVRPGPSLAIYLPEPCFIFIYIHGFYSQRRFSSGADILAMPQCRTLYHSRTACHCLWKQPSVATPLPRTSRSAPRNTRPWSRRRRRGGPERGRGRQPQDHTRPPPEDGTGGEHSRPTWRTPTTPKQTSRRRRGIDQKAWRKILKNCIKDF